MKTYKIEIKNGKLVNKDFLLEQLLNLEEGFFNVFVEKAEVGQAKYFYYRDVLADFLGYGTKKEKQELHELIKQELLIGIFKDPENLNTEDYESLTLSTKFLSPKGWNSLNRSLSLWSLTKFDVRLI